MSGYTAMAFAIGSAVMGAAAAADQQQTMNNNIQRQNIINQNNAIASMERANYQAQISYDNAVIAQQEADAIRDLSLEEQRDRALAAKAERGTMATAAAASGFLVDPEGDDSTIYNLFADSDATAQLDILRLRHRADLDARAVEDKGLMHKRQGDLFMMEVAATPGGVGYSEGGSVALAGTSAFFSGATTAAQLRPT
jgi:hypothetical protein